MFSGIIESVGRVSDVKDTDGAREMMVQTTLKQVNIGDSIACNGVCLTADKRSRDGQLAFFISKETLNKTNLKEIQKDQILNLERAVTPMTCLSGHIVQGHVDNVGVLRHLNKSPSGHELIIDVPSFYQKYVVEKGSIAVNGISLTVNKVRKSSSKEGVCKLFLMIIPHTWENTMLKNAQEGDLLNIEFDVMAKYIEAQLEPWRGQE